MRICLAGRVFHWPVNYWPQSGTLDLIKDLVQSKLNLRKEQRTVSLKNLPIIY